MKGYRFGAEKEHLRSPRIVRVGAVQNSIVTETSAQVDVQRNAIYNKIEKIIKAAANSGVNVLCLQEAWSEYPETYKVFNILTFEQSNCLII